MTSIVEANGTYYETLTELSEDEIAALPAGALVVEKRPQYFYQWNREEGVWDYDYDIHLKVETEENRKHRDGLLAELDTLVGNPLRFASYTDQQKVDLANYRQALLDLPQQAGFPLDVVWPIKPL
jgi:hypothetical protein